jgi:hypothetical protein
MSGDVILLLHVHKWCEQRWLYLFTINCIEQNDCTGTYCVFKDRKFELNAQVLQTLCNNK